MLSWAIRKGRDTVAGNGGEVATDDTTQIDQPDTPAPVFAARAFKAAIWGEQSKPSEISSAQPPIDLATPDDTESKTPSKPQGILLTPGTGTSRPKRVSFDRKSIHKAAEFQIPIPDEDRPAAAGNDQQHKQRRTRLTETMAESVTRRHRNADEQFKSQEPAKDRRETAPDSEGDWEELEDDYDDDVCDHDITVDLNEPHSSSGRYWKSQLEQYHQDAKAQMGALIKYKQLAKSYAKSKDAEAIDLGVKLQEEQRKVAQMQKEIGELASKLASSTNDDNAQLLENLSKQTALAMQYREEVKSLEAVIKQQRDNEKNNSQDDGLTRATRPETQKREARRIESLQKENTNLREQKKQMHSSLLEARSENAQFASDNKKLKAENEKLVDKYQKLEKFRDESAERETKLKEVLQRANDKIMELKAEILTLKDGSAAKKEELEKAPASPRTLSSSKNAPAPTLRHHSKRRVSSEDKHVPAVDDDNTTALVEAFRKNLGKDILKANKPNVNHDTENQPIGDPAKPTDKDDQAAAAGSENPRWKPFVPRSPKDRKYLGAKVNGQIKEAAKLPTGRTPARPRALATSRLGGVPMYTPRRKPALRSYDISAVPSECPAEYEFPMSPERRSAALARLAKKREERQRLLRKSDGDKKSSVRA